VLSTVEKTEHDVSLEWARRERQKQRNASARKFSERGARVKDKRRGGKAKTRTLISIQMPMTDPRNFTQMSKSEAGESRRRRSDQEAGRTKKQANKAKAFFAANLVPRERPAPKEAVRTIGQLLARFKRLGEVPLMTVEQFDAYNADGVDKKLLGRARQAVQLKYEETSATRSKAPRKQKREDGKKRVGRLGAGSKKGDGPDWYSALIFVASAAVARVLYGFALTNPDALGLLPFLIAGVILWPSVLTVSSLGVLIYVVAPSIGYCFAGVIVVTLVAVVVFWIKAHFCLRLVVVAAYVACIFAHWLPPTQPWIEKDAVEAARRLMDPDLIGRAIVEKYQDSMSQVVNATQAMWVEQHLRAGQRRAQAAISNRSALNPGPSMHFSRCALNALQEFVLQNDLIPGCEQRLWRRIQADSPRDYFTVSHHRTIVNPQMKQPLLIQAVQVCVDMAVSEAVSGTPIPEWIRIVHDGAFPADPQMAGMPRSRFNPIKEPPAHTPADIRQFIEFVRLSALEVPNEPSAPPLPKDKEPATSGAAVTPPPSHSGETDDSDSESSLSFSSSAASISPPPSTAPSEAPTRNKPSAERPLDGVHLDTRECIAIIKTLDDAVAYRRILSVTAETVDDIRIVGSRNVKQTGKSMILDSVVYLRWRPVVMAAQLEVMSAQSHRRWWLLAAWLLVYVLISLAFLLLGVDASVLTLEGRIVFRSFVAVLAILPVLNSVDNLAVLWHHLTQPDNQRPGTWPVYTPLEEARLIYAPCMVTSLLSEVSRGTNPMAFETNEHAYQLRLATCPLPDVIDADVRHANFVVTRHLMQDRDFTMYRFPVAPRDRWILI